MAATNRTEQSIIATMGRAVEVTEDALGHVARIAVEGIHRDLEVSSHIEAAERHMRSALRQLVLAERELRSRRPPIAGLDDAQTKVVPGPGAGAAGQRS